MFIYTYTHNIDFQQCWVYVHKSKGKFEIYLHFMKA
jgi:hypothetical protein